MMYVILRFIIRNINLVFVPISGAGLLKPLEFPLSLVNEVAFGLDGRTGAGEV